MSKPFKTLDQQVEILIKRNLIIDNVDEAKFLLTKHSYYSVINGYKRIFLEEKTDINEEDRFKDGTTIKDIINLHDFDKKIRNEILSALENIENTISANIAYIFAERFGDKQSDYINPSYFKLGKSTRKGKSQREVLLDELRRICLSEEHPMKHYRTVHQNIPPWILVQGATFGNLVYIYKLFKKDEKDYLISRCLGVSLSEIDDKLKEFFAKMLEVIWKYRNWAAHGGRIYSHKVSEELPYYHPAYKKFEVTKKNYDLGNGRSDIFALCIAVSFFLKSDVTAQLNFLTGINFFLKRYNEENPKYYFDVLEQMGLPIGYENYFFKEITRINPSEFLQKIRSAQVPLTVPV